MKFYSILFLITLVCCTSRLAGQYRVTKHFTTKDGLPSNEVLKFEKDQFGYLWIGTMNGVSRFDGKRFTNFHNLGTEGKELQGNSVYNLLTTRDTSVWVSTYGGGISKYDYDSNTFETIQKGDGVNSILEDRVMGMIEVDSNAILIHYRVLAGFSGGMTLMDRNGNVEKHLFQDIIQEDGFKYRFRDHSLRNDVLITLGQKLYEIDTKDFSYKIHEYPFEVKRYSEVWAVNHIEEDKLLVGGDDGLYLFDKHEVKWDTIDLNINVEQVITSQDEQLILTPSKIYTYNPKSKALEVILSRNNLLRKPERPTFKRMFLFGDYLWIGTDKGIWSLEVREPMIEQKALDYPDKKMRAITPLSKDSEGIMHYISRSGDILKGKETKLVRIGKIEGIVHDIIDITSDKKNWMFAGDGGIHSYNIDSQEIVDIRQKYNLKPLFDDDTWSVYLEEEVLWIGTRTKGLFKYNIELDSLINFKNDPTNPFSLCFDRYLFDISKGPDGFLWISTDQGLSVINPENNEWIRYPEIIDTLHEYIVHHSESGSKYMWIGTRDHGLYRYDIESKKSKVYTLKDGLPFTGVNRILCKNGLVYCSTREGIAIVNEETDQIDVFNEKDGLKQSGLYLARMTLDGENNLIVSAGNDNSIYEIKSSELFKDSEPPPTIIEKVQVNGGIDSRDYFYPSHKLSLEANQNNFIISYNTVEYENMSIEYRYRLEGYDTDWQYAGSRQTVNYARLKGGKYSFTVQSSSVGSEWGQSSTLTFVIDEFWYNSLWFMFLVIGASLGILYFLYNARIQKVKLDQKYQNLLSDVEMKALRSQMNPHFIFNALNSIKSFIIENDRRNATDYLNKFSKLIRLILNHSKSDRVPLHKELEAIRLYIDMERLRFNAFEFDLTIDENLDRNKILIQPMIIQPFLENAIWHGLLHKKNGNRELKINVSKGEGDELSIIIQDNGVGRKKAQELKSKSVLENKSYGMAITEERIHLASKSNQLKYVTIIDLYDEETPIGTEVRLLIPFTMDDKRLKKT